MISFEDLPSVTASFERLADWIEFRALTSPQKAVSRADLLADLRIAGTSDLIPDPDDETDDEATLTHEGIADAVFAELNDRLLATGGETGTYPFILSENLLELKPGMGASVYPFLIVLAFWADEGDALFKEGVKLFEDVSAAAAKNYLGGTVLTASSAVFGFPRRVLPAGFAAAVEQLCKQLGEGNGPNRSRPKLKDQKDAKLDIVAWSSFLDGRSGKLIAFGQCAAGTNWASKTTELGDPIDWWTKWVVDRPGTWPIRMFFVPHRISMYDWFDVCASVGILFDRCRIAHLSGTLPEPLRTACTSWTDQVLKRVSAT